MATVMAEWTEVISKHQAAILNIYSLSKTDLGMRMSYILCSALIDKICLACGHHQCKDHYTKLYIQALLLQNVKFKTPFFFQFVPFTVRLYCQAASNGVFYNVYYHVQ